MDLCLSFNKKYRYNNNGNKTFMRIVFLAIVRVIRSSLLFGLIRLIVALSPSKHSEGHNGM